MLKCCQAFATPHPTHFCGSSRRTKLKEEWTNQRGQLTFSQRWSYPFAPPKTINKPWDEAIAPLRRVRDRGLVLKRARRWLFRDDRTAAQSVPILNFLPSSRKFRPRKIQFDLFICDSNHIPHVSRLVRNLPHVCHSVDFSDLYSCRCSLPLERNHDPPPEKPGHGLGRPAEKHAMSRLWLQGRDDVAWSARSYKELPRIASAGRGSTLLLRQHGVKKLKRRI